jgi:hypothetical protein
LEKRREIAKKEIESLNSKFEKQKAVLNQYKMKYE